MHQSSCDLQAALHPARVGEDDIVGSIDQPHASQDLSHALGYFRSAHAVELAVEDQILASGEAIVQRGVLE